MDHHVPRVLQERERVPRAGSWRGALSNVAQQRALGRLSRQNGVRRFLVRCIFLILTEQTFPQ